MQTITVQFTAEGERALVSQRLQYQLCSGFSTKEIFNIGFNMTEAIHIYNIVRGSLCFTELFS